MSKIIFTGIESSGKSLRMAMEVEKIVERNAKWFELTKKIRPIYSNLIFTKTFEEWALKKWIPIHYWKDLDELVEVENADIIIDEIGNYFDARNWSALSLDIRRWITQGAKVGNEIIGSAQDFAQVDLAFRRLVNELYEIKKLIGSRRPSNTKPPVKKIWGLCWVRELQAQNYKEEEKKYMDLLGSIFFIDKKYCDIFDTTQKIVKSKPTKLKHIERFCEHYHDTNSTCKFCKTYHE